MNGGIIGIIIYASIICAIYFLIDYWAKNIWYATCWCSISSSDCLYDYARRFIDNSYNGWSYFFTSGISDNRHQYSSTGIRTLEIK